LRLPVCKPGSEPPADLEKRMSFRLRSYRGAARTNSMPILRGSCKCLPTSSHSANKTPTWVGTLLCRHGPRTERCWSNCSTRNGHARADLLYRAFRSVVRRHVPRPSPRRAGNRPEPWPAPSSRCPGGWLRGSARVRVRAALRIVFRVAHPKQHRRQRCSAKRQTTESLCCGCCGG